MGSRPVKEATVLHALVPIIILVVSLSYLSFNRHQSELLFKVISDRAEKSSVMISSNLEFSRWTELFENPTLITALVDRPTFRSHILTALTMNLFAFS